MCLARLPEGPANPVLTMMLAPAPYQMPEKEEEVGGKMTKDGLYSQGTSDFVSGGIKIPSSEDKSKGGPLSLSLPRRRGTPPKIGRSRLLSEARCLWEVARAWRTSKRSLMTRTSFRPGIFFLQLSMQSPSTILFLRGPSPGDDGKRDAPTGFSVQ